METAKRALSLGVLRGTREACHYAVQQHVGDAYVHLWSPLEVLVLLEPGCGVWSQVSNSVRETVSAGVRTAVRARPAHVPRDVVEAAFTLGGIAAAEKLLRELP